MLLAPIRFAPWIPIAALFWFFYRFVTNRDIDGIASDQRLLVVFAITAVAAGLQVRFLVDSGSPPDYSLAAMASLFLIQIAFGKNASMNFRRFIPTELKSQVPSIVIAAVVIPSIAFVVIGKPALNFVRNNPTFVATSSGTFLAKGREAPTIGAIKHAIDTATPDGSPVLSSSFTQWVNFIVDRPGLLPITQTQILKVKPRWIADTMDSLKSDPPALIVEDLINDDGTEYGGWGSNSRAFSPWLWEYVQDEYVYCAKFVDGEPRDGLWGARFYVQRDPKDSYPDCEQFKAASGLQP